MEGCTRNFSHFLALYTNHELVDPSHSQTNVLVVGGGCILSIYFVLLFPLCLLSLLIPKNMAMSYRVDSYSPLMMAPV